jgi:hypothetical protein
MNSLRNFRRSPKRCENRRWPRYTSAATTGAFLVRIIRDDVTRAALKAPAGAAFVVQSIERTQGSAPSVKFIDLRSEAHRRCRPARLPLDRARAHGMKAAAASDQVLTDPYVFFTTHEPGITFARKSRSGRGVVPPTSR